MVASLVLGSTGTSTILALSNPLPAISQPRNQTEQHGDDNNNNTNNTTSGSELVLDFIGTTTNVDVAGTESPITKIISDQEKLQQGDAIVRSIGVHDKVNVHDGYQNLDDATTKTSERIWLEEEEEGDGTRDTENGRREVDELQREEEEEEDDAHPIHQGAHPGGGGWKGGGQWAGSHKLCQGAAFFTNFVTSASAITVAVIALDRYLAIVRPMVYGLMVTGNRCLVMLAWCWVQAALTALPPLLGWARYEHRGPEGRCGVAWGSSPSYTAVWALSVFLVPVLIMLVSYYFILQVARNKCRRIHVGKVLGGSTSSPPITPDPSSSVYLDGPALTDLSRTASSLVQTPRDLLQLQTSDLTPTSSENPPLFPLINGYAHQLGNGAGTKMESSVISESKYSLRNIFGADTRNGPRSLLGNGNTGGVGSIISNGRQIRNGMCPPLAMNSLEIGQGKSRSISGMNKINEGSAAVHPPKKKLADCGRSLSFSQQHTQQVRPCLRRAQSSLSVRPATIRKKFSLAARRPSWSWEASPAKGFRTVCVVVGTHVFTWAPYTALAVTEAALGPEKTNLIPGWAYVTSTLLLFTASVFYPIVYGLYNRSIRKEVVACVCPGSSRDRRRGSCHRRASTLHSNTGSVLDFSSLRHRDDELLQRHQESSAALGILSNSSHIRTISGALTVPALPALPCQMQLAEYMGLTTRGYDITARKPSQDSGAVMSSIDDPDSDLETPALLTPHHPNPYHQPGRRVSAPSVLDTVTEHPGTPLAVFHIGYPGAGSSSSSSTNSNKSSRSPLTPHRKLPIMPLSPQLLSSGHRKTTRQRSRSLDKLPLDGERSERESLLESRRPTHSLRKKHPFSSGMKDPQLCGPSGCERLIRRRGSAVGLKALAIPEDSGTGECSEIPDSGRGSVDSGDVTKNRALQQVSVDEGIGTEYLAEEEAVTQV
ncbi:hypothetical protein Pcinc_028190 [Petrolisthes cinctipes]|uniref:G-protein coupled receptors family 1 profile domain-containing protein n=1 Tax=Petrolisthes cinctipes TaxID=88211 RepID=A0AAE1F3K2_PETCI|nr:hypothetical protein Pcinc_028190 [Petrolisthes cinctipes]